MAWLACSAAALAFCQFFFGLLAFGDIADGFDGTHEIALCIVQGGSRGKQVARSISSEPAYRFPPSRVPLSDWIWAYFFFDLLMW